MTGKPRSLRQTQALHASQLRGQGRTWAEIAAVFSATYRVNPRVALRQAHGWSQPQAAERWTARWPEDPKTFKNFSYWEQWPGSTGHAPSLDTLDRLAQLYQCKLTDLLTDCDDYGKPSSAGRPRADGYGLAVVPPRMPLNGGRMAPVPGQATLTPPPSIPALQSALETIRRARVGELLEVAGDPDEPDRRLRRRTLLLEASSALALVAAAPVLEVPRLPASLRSGRLRGDPAIVSYTGEVVAGLRRLGGTVGPRTTLPSAMALRSAMAALARNAPEIVTSHSLAVYGDLTQLIGWMMFNLGDHKAAGYYYDDARSAAYRGDNHDLAAYTLSSTAQLAIARGLFRQAIDHAHAAQRAARTSDSPYAVAYAADITARAYAAAGQLSRCQAALDREQAVVSEIGNQTPRAPWWYFYDRSFYWVTECECALRLGRPVDASDAGGRALGELGPLSLHATAMAQTFRAEALIRMGEIDEACEVLASSARLTTLNSSRRISRRVDSLSKQLRKAESYPAVRELDEKLAQYRRARVAAEPVDAMP